MPIGARLLVPVSFAGSHAVSGVVSGTAVSTFDGSIIGPLTIDSRTLTTNYNVADNATGAHDLWLRGGFAWTPLSNVTVKDQYYSYQAKRSWFDSETYAFNNATSTIDRDRFFVTHNQHIIGDNADLTWDSRILGMDNRFAAQLAGQQQLDHIRAGRKSGRFSGRHRFRHQPLARRVRPGISQYAEQPAHRRRWIVRGPSQDHAGLCADRRGAPGAIDAQQVRCELRRHHPGRPAFLQETWKPVSYRAAYTYEPIPGLTFYSMYATAYDPAGPPSSPSRRTRCN